MCANEDQLAASTCSPQDKYRANVLRTLKENEEACSSEAENSVFVAKNPVNGQGECKNPPASPLPGTMQAVVTHASIAGAPLSKAAVAITQMSMLLHPVTVSNAAVPTEAPTAAPTEDFAAEGFGNVTVSVLLGESAAAIGPAALAVCRTSRSVVSVRHHSKPAQQYCSEHLLRG